MVCREHEDKSKFSDLLDDPVFLCSISCGHDFECKIWEAARATSAAWTYFPLTKIGRRFFSDGGVEYNNPSFTIWDHYTVEAETRRNRSQYNHSKEPMSPNPTHPGVDFSHCRIVNIGTGSNISGKTPPREREKFASIIPDSILFGLFLKRTLTKVATASDRVADQMRTVEEFRRGELIFDRLSASNGVCWIKLDRYLELDNITKLTNEWLEQHETQTYITKLAADIAREYLEAHTSASTETSQRLTAAQPTNDHSTSTEVTVSPQESHEARPSVHQTQPPSAPELARALENRTSCSADGLTGAAPTARTSLVVN